MKYSGLSIINILIVLAVLSSCSCNKNSQNNSVIPDNGQEGTKPEISAPEADTYDCTVSIDASSFVSTGYIGNGVQWDPYEVNDISEADWQKLYNRLDFMKPQFIRMMHNISEKSENGVLINESGLDHLTHLLDYCQSRDITVMFGDWGGSLADPEKGTINETLLRNVAAYLDFLINKKGYDCIKYYNLVNEPNGDWSQTKGDYTLWSRAVKFFWEEAQKLGLDRKIKMAAPDIAIWTAEETFWVSNTVRDFPEATGIYDIHTYPSKVTVNSGEYTEIIKAYKDVSAPGSKIVMGEIGFKYREPEDAAYQAENLKRAENLAHASIEDSQMYVYDYMYGTDMADAVFQTINAGFSGCVAWMLDDAMHFKEPGKLKIWGFWNIFGDERFGSEHEVVRPWFYAWSLLCSYLPRGTDFYTVNVSGIDGVKAIAAVHKGKRTIAVVNVAKEERKVNITAKDFADMDKVRKYVYGEGLFTITGDCTMHPVATDMDFSPSKGEILKMPGESLILLTEL
jgi:hypothetical protein